MSSEILQTCNLVHTPRTKHGFDINNNIDVLLFCSFSIIFLALADRFRGEKLIESAFISHVVTNRLSSPQKAFYYVLL